MKQKRERKKEKHKKDLNQIFARTQSMEIIKADTESKIKAEGYCECYLPMTVLMTMNLIF